ncbi:MAG: glycosyltransferase [Pseudomonadota bacterium]
MKIGLNAGTLRGLGSSFVGRHLVSALVEKCEDHELVMWVPDVWQWNQKDFGANVRIMNVAAGALNKGVFENVHIRREIGRGRIQKLFSLCDASILRCSVPHLLLVQQAHLVFEENEYGFLLSARAKLRHKMMAQYFKAGMSSVTCFTVQSQHMKRRLSTRWGIPQGNIVVVPSAIEDIDVSEVAPLSTTPYVCYLASASPHKNHLLLAELCAALGNCANEISCVVTVDRKEVPDLVSMAQKYGVLNRIVFVGRLSTLQARRLLFDALALVMPSKMESFCLPLYEAMSVGCPVVAADEEYAHDACGDVALYADVNSGEAFAQHVAALFDSEQKRAYFGKAGQMRFLEMRKSWPEIAQQYLSIIDST